MKVCAGIVLYNAEEERLKQNINAIATQVDSIVLVDNGSHNIDNIIENVINKSAYNMHLIKSEKNKGIAWALNRIHEYAFENGYSWFLTLDQDTITNEGLIENYIKHIKNDIGQLSCNIIDRNVGRIDEIKDYDGSDTKEIDFCITSGCFNNTHALTEVGGFNESLFIDGVDLDISCNLRKHGYKILNVDFDGIIHELGNGKKHNILGIKFSTANHIPWRNYYARRNIIYVARKYYTGVKKYKMIIRQIAYGIGAVILENKKITRLYHNFKGIIHGLTMHL